MRTRKRLKISVKDIPSSQNKNFTLKFSEKQMLFVHENFMSVACGGMGD